MKKADTRAKKLIVITLAVCCLVTCTILVAGSVSGEVNLRLHDGGAVRISPPSYWGMWLRRGCKVRYQSSKGMSGTISLIDDFADEPLMVIVSEDEKALLCLHALEDMGLWLLRIDTTKAFEGFPAGFDHWDELVEASPWQVEMGSSYDWRWMYMKLKDMPENEFKKTAIPWSDFGHPQVYVKQEKIVPRLKGYAEPLIFQ